MNYLIRTLRNDDPPSKRLVWIYVIGRSRKPKSYVIVDEERTFAEMTLDDSENIHIGETYLLGQCEAKTKKGLLHITAGMAMKKTEFHLEKETVRSDAESKGFTFQETNASTAVISMTDEVNEMMEGERIPKMKLIAEWEGPIFTKDSKRIQTVTMRDTKNQKIAVTATEKFVQTLKKGQVYLLLNLEKKTWKSSIQWLNVLPKVTFTEESDIQHIPFDPYFETINKDTGTIVSFSPGINIYDACISCNSKTENGVCRKCCKQVEVKKEFIVTMMIATDKEELIKTKIFSSNIKDLEVNLDQNNNKEVVKNLEKEYEGKKVYYKVYTNPNRETMCSFLLLFTPKNEMSPKIENE